MKYSEFAIESMRQNLIAKAMNSSTPKGLAAMLFEAAEIIAQLRSERNSARRKTPPCQPGDPLWWIADEDDDGKPGKCVKLDERGIRGVLLRDDGWYIENTDGSIDKLGSRWACLTKEDAERVLAEMESGERDGN